MVIFGKIYLPLHPVSPVVIPRLSRATGLKNGLNNPKTTFFALIALWIIAIKTTFVAVPLHPVSPVVIPRLSRATGLKNGLQT